MKFLITILSLLITVCNIYGQDFWQPLNGPYGGKVVDIAAKSNGDLFALKDNNVYFSSNNGVSWSEVNKGFDYTNLSMAVSSTGILYVGKSSGGIWWSGNNGQSWDFSPVRVAPHSGTWVSVYTIAVNTSGHIFIGGFRSLNGGQTWLDMPISNAVPRNYAFNSAGHIYAATNQGIFKSTDNGGSWTPSNNDIGSTLTSVVRAGSDNVIYAGTSSAGIFKSVNDGANWTPVNNGIPDNQITAIEITPGRIYAGTKTAGVFVSDNGGSSWSPVNTGLQISQVNSIETFGAGNVYTATIDAGLFKSVNNGGSWSESNAGMFHANMKTIAFKNGGHIFAGAFGGFFHSADNGITWTLKKQGLTNTAIQCVAVSQSGKIFASLYNGGIYASTNNGDSWFNSGAGITAAGRFLKVFVHPNGNIFLINPPISFTDSLKVYKSTDDGVTWANIHTNESMDDAIMDPAGNIYMCGMNIQIQGLVLRSMDAGNTWQKFNFGMGLNFNALAADGTKLFAASNDKIYESTNHGANWTQINGAGWPSASPVGPIFMGAGKLFVRSALGITYTGNSGQSWVNVSSGLPNGITLFAIDNNSFLYAGTTEKGIYRSAQSVLTSITPVTEVASYYRLEQNYPNPFNPSTVISFSIPRESFVKLEVFSLNGEKAASIINGDMRKGQYNINFDAGMYGLSSGAYFYRLEAGDFKQSKKMLFIK